MWKRTTRWRGVWLRVASLGHPRRALTALAGAAAVWHGHQLIPMMFSADLDFSDLLALIHLATTSAPSLMCFIVPIPCRWRMCSVASASMINTGFTAKPRSCSGPFASALLLAMIFCFLVYAFKGCHPTSATPALDDFLVSLSPAQSGPVKYVTSEAMCPNSKLLQVPNESLQFGKAVL